MRILLTNDDGIEAEGLQSLYRRLVAEHDVFVVAPHEQRSNCGHCVTVQRPLSVVSVASNQWTIDGFPADCIRVAMAHLKLPIDLVVSGINHGGNLGVDVVMSGTCAAAREAAIHGIPGIAISQVRKHDIKLDWDTSSQRAFKLFDQVRQLDKSGPGFWNINLPAVAPDQVLDQSKVCILETNPLPLSYEMIDNRLEYRSDYHSRKRGDKTDVAYCFEGIASLTFVAIP